VRYPGTDVDEIDRAIAEHLIRDVDAIDRLGVPRLWKLHGDILRFVRALLQDGGYIYEVPIT
jgi:hypothetical protein